MNIKKILLATLSLTMLSACGQTKTSSSSYNYAETIKWDAEYDVVVAGFGAAGIVSAISAADEGANVLVVEKASEGESGGNSKVAGQLFFNGHGDVDNTYNYLKAIAGDTDISDEILEVVAQGVATMEDTFVNVFGANPEEFTGTVIPAMSPEYPEFGFENLTLDTLHKGASDSFMYKTLKNSLKTRTDNVDVWFESPAIHLIQDPQSKTIIGLQVERKGEVKNIRATNGVVLATGGFENNKKMVETFLGLTNYVPIGGLYNTGDGIRMAQEVGADLWHMHVYEGGFALGGTSFKVDEGQSASQVGKLGIYPINSGSLIMVGDGGQRYVNESEMGRHGHFYNNGTWTNPIYPMHSWIIFDEKKAIELQETDYIPEQFKKDIIEAQGIKELSEAINVNAETLENTLLRFNEYAISGNDHDFFRPAEHMEPLDLDKLYAIEVIPEILNTQGGPRKNENAEILDVNGNPIPHLYEAGELGGITSGLYQGGMNLNECIIFGQIAGKNAAKVKESLPTYNTLPKVESNPTSIGDETDFGNEIAIETAENEYVGVSEGMGGNLYVKVKFINDTIEKIEIVQQSETEGIADKALSEIPDAIVKSNSTDVETVSGATITSNAIINAVNDALSKIK